MTHSYSPHEPGHILSDEVAWLQGAFISSLLCGAQITLSVMSFFAVLKQCMHHRMRIALLVYIALLCAIMTTGEQVSLMFVQRGFIQDRKYPGGPNAFLSDRYATPVDMASTSLFVVGNWMMESLLVWRCKVVCCTGERPLWFGVIIPFMMLICEYVTGTLFLYKMVQGGNMLRYALAYTSLSLVLNVTVTAIIVVKLLLHRRRMVKLFGPGHGSHYASVATVLIESASLYTVFVILVITFFLVSSPLSNALQQLVPQIESITSQLIIYRIAHGKGWGNNAVVMSVDWRGSPDAQVVHEVVYPEKVSDPGPTEDLHVPSILSKDNQTATPKSANAGDASFVQDGVV